MTYLYPVLLLAALAGGSPDPGTGFTPSRAGLPALLGQAKPDEKKIIPTPGPASSVTIPASIKVKQGQLVRLKAESPSPVTWQVPKAMALPADYEELPDNRLILPSDKPGRWIVQAWAVVGMPPKAVASNECLIEVTGSLPGPVPPGPGPGPGPQPTDFRSLLTSAYQSDQAAGRGERERARELMKLWVECGIAGSREDFKNLSDFLRWYAEALNRLFFLHPSTMTDTRKVLGTRLQKEFSEDKPLTNGTRRQLVNVFREAALIMEELTKEPAEEKPK